MDPENLLIPIHFYLKHNKHSCIVSGAFLMLVHNPLPFPLEPANDKANNTKQLL